MATPRHLAVPALALTALLLLTGCAGSEPQAGPPVTEESPAASATPEPTEDPAVFTKPTECDAILPPERLADFDAQGLALLGGPGGKYGTEYLADPTPEENLGGITCIWGFADSDFASVTISVAPVTAADRSGIVSSLTDQGLNEESEGEATTFAVQGDADSQPAVVNVLRFDSWISVIETVGGEEFYAEAVLLASEVGETVYTTP
ncbi:hypothetical protein [Glaciihabitans arcticus]|uniref:hypothetical protein n=1 Tax=Glaciihabitans arcticus TaxID=2668039 RepID=UPI001F02EE46|nr:hypothetical protein [Glaciihabitans arcticus]